MRAFPYMPGVPAAGHISGKGFWHPGAVDNCVKCDPPAEPGPTMNHNQAIRERGRCDCPCHRGGRHCDCRPRL